MYFCEQKKVIDGMLAKHTYFLSSLCFSNYDLIFAWHGPKYVGMSKGGDGQVYSNINITLVAVT
jgi:hypothetical protein